MSYRRLCCTILGVLFLSTVINYLDRQTLSVLAPTLRSRFHLTDRDYANAVSAFLISYTVMYTVAGRIIDRVGVQVGIVACVTWWSVATMLTSLTRGAKSLALYRFLVGIGEPGIYPAGLKACAEWFPKEKRAFAAGIFSSGSAVGAIIAPPLIAWITLKFHWSLAFLIPGALGLLWVPIWLKVYRPPDQHPAVTAEDLAMLRRDAGDAPPPRTEHWSKLLRQERVWAMVLPRLASDPVWYFYLFWLPDYFERQRGFTLSEIGAFMWIPFLAADVGNIGGGVFSDWLIRRGVNPRKARLAVLVAVGCLSPLGGLSGIVGSRMMALGIVSLMTCLTQCWSTNIATLALDTFPRHENATVVGMMGTAGSVGGILFSQVLGVVITKFGYASAFVIAGSLHPIAVITLLLLLRPSNKAAL